jgi:hypothetical protein
MQVRWTTGEGVMNSEGGNGETAVGLPIDPAELARLERWIPAREMALVFEIFDRAGSDPDLMRPALLLWLAYAERVARMLDQDPFPTVTKRIKDRLEQLRAKHGF